MSGTEHMDEDSTEAATEQPTHLPTLDSFAAVRDLIALCIDARAVKVRLRQLHDSLAATAAAQRQLESDRAAFAEYEKATRAELAARETKLREREVNVHIGEGQNKERAEAINAEKQRWAALRLPGEPAEMFGSISRGRPFSGYEVAKHYADHGVLPDHPDKPLPLDEGEPPEPSPAPVRRGHGDSGDWPANVTLTKEPEHPVRVRVGRRGAQA